MTYFEIDAQIQAIKQLKRKYNKVWDTFTLEDIFLKKTSLYSIAQLLAWNYGKDILEIWEKNLVKRMAREGLLGKNMRSFISISRLFD